jgi:hypothetical protein
LPDPWTKIINHYFFFFLGVNIIEFSHSLNGSKS